MLAEQGGDLREHARPVGDLQRDLVPGHDARDRQDRQVRVRRLGDARAADDVPARGRDHVAEHGRCGLDAAGPRPVEHQAARRLRLEEDGVVGPVHRGERMRVAGSAPDARAR